MIYTSVISSSKESMQMIAAAASQFEKEAYFESIRSCRITKAEVIKLNAEVKNATSILHIKQYELWTFASTFNCRYATDDNKCFDTAQQLLHKIRNAINTTTRVFKRFCKSEIRRNVPLPEDRRPHALVMSNLVKRRTWGDFFANDSYDDCAYELYESLQEFFYTLLSCLQICHTVIKEESLIRNTPSKCKKIYEQCFKEVENNCAMVLKMMKAINEDQSIDNEEFPISDVCKSFHMHNEKEFHKHVVQKILIKSRKDQLTSIETALWPEKNEEVKLIRYIIAHFDELNPEGHKGKLSGYVLAAFAEWCGIGVDGDKKLKKFVEEYFNVEYKGKYDTINANTVNTAKNKMMFNEDLFNKKRFIAQINSLLKKRCSAEQENCA